MPIPVAARGCRALAATTIAAQAVALGRRAISTGSIYWGARHGCYFSSVLPACTGGGTTLHSVLAAAGITTQRGTLLPIAVTPLKLPGTVLIRSSRCAGPYATETLVCLLKCAACLAVH